MNPDFSDMSSALSAEGVEHLVVGAHARYEHNASRFVAPLVLVLEATIAAAAHSPRKPDYKVMTSWDRVAVYYDIRFTFEIVDRKGVVKTLP